VRHAIEKNVIQVQGSENANFEDDRDFNHSVSQPAGQQLNVALNKDQNEIPTVKKRMTSEVTLPILIPTAAHLLTALAAEHVLLAVPGILHDRTLLPTVPGAQLHHSTRTRVQHRRQRHHRRLMTVQGRSTALPSNEKLKRSQIPMMDFESHIGVHVVVNRIQRK